jgi:hypothetical protein
LLLIVYFIFLSKNQIEERQRKLVQLEREIDDLIAADCPLCGRLIIDDITKPFITDIEARAAAEWDV